MRILGIQNISGGSLTIDGILSANNEWIYPNYSWWQTDNWRPLSSSTNIKVSLTDGTQYTYTLNPEEFTKAFVDTHNFAVNEEEVLIEFEKPQISVTTTNNTPTVIAIYNLRNGNHTLSTLVKGRATTGTDTYIGRHFMNVKVISNVATLVNNITTGQIVGSNFPGGVGVTATTSGNKIIISVTGRTGTGIGWIFKLLNIE